MCDAYKVPPYPGGLSEWPNIIVQAFAIIRSVRNQYDEVKREKISAGIK